MLKRGPIELLAEQTAPATPPANTVRVYAKDDGSGESTLVYQSDAGTEYPVGGGGGGVTALPQLTDVDDALGYTAGNVLRADGAQFTNEQLAHSDVSGAGTNAHSAIDGHIDTDATVHASATNLVKTTGAQTVAGVKTFSSFPVTPSSLPTTDYQVTNKSYVDTLVTTGRFVGAVNASTTAALPACTYANGALGVGATLTGDANGALAAQDGQTLTVNQTLLVKDQASGLQNGAYALTQVGDAGTPFILTRTTTYDQAAEIFGGTFFNVLAGTANGNEIWGLTTTGTVVVGTTALTYAQLSSVQVYTASMGVEKVGSDFRADLLANGGLELTGNEIGVNTDDSSIEKDGTGNLQVKAAGVTNAMLAGSIADSKLSQITTVSKVSGAALTSLASIPAGAGQVPIANMATGAPTGSKFVRDDGVLAVPAGSGAGVATINYVKALTSDQSSTAVTNTVAETTIYTYSVAGGVLSTDKGIHFVVKGTYQNNSGGNKTLTFRVKYGATTICARASGNIGTHASAGVFFLEGYILARGATNSQYGFMRCSLETGANATVEWSDRGSASEDSTGALDLVVTVQHSAASAQISLVSRGMIVSQLNASDNIGAPTDAAYWTSEANGNLSAETNLGLLTTGLLKHSVAAGVSTPATAVADTDYLVPATAAATYAPIAKGVTNGDTHDHSGGDGAQIDHGGLGGLTDNDHTQYVLHSLATAENDVLVGNNPVGTWVKKTLADFKTILGLGTAAYTASTDYVTHALATVANDFLVASGAGVFVKKTLAETLTILGKAAASGLASLDAGSLVVQNPANATATPTASKIPIADGSGLLDGWVSAASLTVAGKVELATTAEIDTGTDSTRAIPVDQLVASKRNVRYINIRVLDKATDCSVLAGVGGDFESPIAGTIVEIGAYVDTAGTTGTMTVDINKNGATLMTTNKVTLDTTEKSSRTAATPPALTTTSLAIGDLITVDIDAIHTTAAKGLTWRMGVRES